jgi:hypothetical protein
MIAASRRGFLRGLGATLLAPAVVSYANLMPVKSFIAWEPDFWLGTGSEAHEGFSGWFAAQYGMPSAEDYMKHVLAHDLPRAETALVYPDNPLLREFCESQRATGSKQVGFRRTGSSWRKYDPFDPLDYPPNQKIRISRVIGTPKPDVLPQVLVPQGEAERRAAAVIAQAKSAPVELLPEPTVEELEVAEDSALIATGRVIYSPENRALTQDDYKGDGFDVGIYSLWKKAEVGRLQRMRVEQLQSPVAVRV